MPSKECEGLKQSRTKFISHLPHKLLLILPLLSIVGIILSFLMFRMDIKDIHIELFKATLASNASHKLIDADNLLNDMVGRLESAAKALDQYDDLCSQDVRRLLQFAKDSSLFSYTAVASPDGTCYDNKGHQFDVADREYFQDAMKGQVAFSEVMDSKMAEDGRVQVIAHPIRQNQGGVKGVVFGVFQLQDIEKFSLHEEDELDGNIYIVDSLGAYIAQFRKNKAVLSNDNFWSDLEQSSLSTENLLQMQADFDEHREGSFSYTSAEGKQRYVCYMPIGPNKWQLVYSVSAASLDQVVDSLYRIDVKNTLLATACYAILILCIVWYFKQSNAKIKAAHQEAQRNIELMRISIEHSKHIVFEYNQAAREIHLKTNVPNQLFRHSVTTSVPESIEASNVIVPDSIPAFEQLFETIQTERSSEAEIQLICDAEEVWYRISMNNVYDERGNIIDTVGVVENISLLKKREAEMNRKLQIQNTLIANALFYAKVDLATDTLMELNGEETNTSFRDFLHEQITETVSPEHMAYVEQELSLESLKNAYQQGKESIEVQFLQKYGQEVKWVSCVVYRMYMDDTSKVIFVMTDIDARKRREMALKELAERDGLTGLYNSATSRQKVNEILSSSPVSNGSQVFVLIDLDNYKLINDTFGHSYGDQVLIDVASLLHKRFRSSDIIGRLGGDEFIILLRDMKSCEHTDRMINELCRSLHRTYRDGGKEVTISASIGIAVAPIDGNTFDELYSKSDIAQYQVKKSTKNGYRRFQSTAQQHTPTQK